MSRPSLYVDSAATAGAPARRTWPITLCAVGFFAIVSALVLLGGCSNQGAMVPNSDPALRKKTNEFVADAANRHPYQPDAPRGGQLQGRAQVNYSADTIEIMNFSNEDWAGVDLWVNELYVVHLPRVEKGAPRTKRIDFNMLYDARGQQFPTDNLSADNHVKKVEVLRDGNLYDLKVSLAE